MKKWYAGHPLVWLLSPLSIVFWAVSSVRRLAYHYGLKNVYRSKANVIVVGNISVGGNGKTPVVLALAQYYKTKGIRVGILSRGYGGKSASYPRVVSETDDPSEVGDEPSLLASRSGVPVVIDPKRKRGADYLSHALNCELIICDDGLQHYALHRDVEVVVMDERLTGSGWLLPMGPLREGHWRLSTVDAIVHNRADAVLPTIDAGNTGQYCMTLAAGDIASIGCDQRTLSLEEIKQKPVTAMAGIGSPERFFTQLTSMGVTLKNTLPFPDHYQFVKDDIPSGRVIMTEKDAVKVNKFAHDDCWYLPVSARISADFFDKLNDTLIKAGLKLELES